MYERVQAGGGQCAADEASRKSADVHLPGTGTSCARVCEDWLAGHESAQEVVHHADPRSGLRAGPGCTRVGDLALHSHDQMN